MQYTVYNIIRVLVARSFKTVNSFLLRLIIIIIIIIMHYYACITWFIYGLYIYIYIFFLLTTTVNKVYNKVNM